MYSTKLTEKEKESLIKWLCTQGELKTEDDGKTFVFEFYNKSFTFRADDEFSPARLLGVACVHLQNQRLGIEK